MTLHADQLDPFLGVRPASSREAEESLTLDTAARARAAFALSEAIGAGFSPHWCDEWDEGDGCTICWDVAAAVIRAAEGLQKCRRCNGTGDVGAGAAVCCDECGGNGLEPLAAATDNNQEGEQRV